MSIIVINGRTMVSIYDSIVGINGFYKDSMDTQCFTMYSHWLSVFIICEANDLRSKSFKGLFTEIQCITIVSLCPPL